MRKQYTIIPQNNQNLPSKSPPVSAILFVLKRGGLRTSNQSPVGIERVTPAGFFFSKSENAQN